MFNARIIQIYQNYRNKNVRNKCKLSLDIFVVNQVTYGTKISEILDLKYGTLYHTT